LKQIDFKGASGMIIFLAGSCLSGLVRLRRDLSAKIYLYLKRQRFLKAKVLQKTLFLQEA
jgi:hypothetical protein